MDDLDIIEDKGEALKEKLIVLLDSWGSSMNWKTYKNNLFPTKALAYYRYIQYPAIQELDPIDSNTKRNDFIYWEMHDIGTHITFLNDVIARYSLHSPEYRISFLKRYQSNIKKKKSSKGFLKKITKEGIQSSRRSLIKNYLNECDLEDCMYLTSIIYRDFCRIYEYLTSNFDRSIPVNPLVKSDPWSGTLKQAVLYHVTLINSGVEEDIDRTSIQKECGRLAEKYGFTGYKRFSDYFNAIMNNKKKARSGEGDTFSSEDAERVEKALKQNYPERPDIIEHLYDKTRPIYP
ncbi:hypothetical protein [Salegentibacter mishustinae]|uniref:hypothetical protein n=1 Tax=Salegentibacter mishustinae TaxID=270918 RepID=UPI00248F5ED6|nr:hypothetical protein [Salegentibacter mishustinae]